MDKNARPIQEYFDAAREQPGISEEAVRSIVATGPRQQAPPQQSERKRRGGLMAMVGAGIAIAIGALVISNQNPNPGRVTIAGAVAPGNVETVARNRTSSRGDVAAAATPETMSEPVVTHTKNSTQLQHVRKENIMTKKSLAAVLSMGLMAGATAALPADTLAQTTQGTPRSSVSLTVDHTNDLPPVLQKMEAEIGTFAADYLVARLNEYKVRIDRALSPADLAELNKMRVQFGLKISQTIKNVDMAKSSTSEANSESQAKGEKGKKHSVEFKIGMEGNGGELMTLHSGAKGIASRYRGEMDGLGTTILEDVQKLVNEVLVRSNKFMVDHRSELEKTELGKKMIEENMLQAKGTEMIDKLNSNEMKGMWTMIYGMAIEPIVMLYDGSDLNVFFRQAGPISSAVTGLNLQESSVLQQSTPNPASTTSTIAYSLTEPSSRTQLKIFSSAGEQVASFDEGAKAPGQHKLAVDVSGFQNGTYLYHLTIQTSKGEQVFSKVMQVAH